MDSDDTFSQRTGEESELNLTELLEDATENLGPLSASKLYSTSRDGQQSPVRHVEAVEDKGQSKNAAADAPTGGHHNHHHPQKGGDRSAGGEGGIEDINDKDEDDVSDDDDVSGESRRPQPLPAPQFDWDELRRDFDGDMAALAEQEGEVRQYWAKLMNMYNVWSAEGPSREEERAAKRLRTRVAYVRQAERELSDKRAHHQNVITAFQQALSLLSGGHQSQEG